MTGAPYNTTDNPNPRGLHPGGRPRKYQTVEELSVLIDQYFETCDKGEIVEVYDKKEQTVKTIERKIPYTITGLGLALNMSRQDLLNYQHDEFFDTIKTAKEKCENYAELRLMSGDMQAAGPIFALKNYGWADKQDIDVKTGGEKINPAPEETLRRLAFMLRAGVETGKSEENS
jgi:hypothetical protein